jgi:hypothetical protein
MKGVKLLDRALPRALAFTIKARRWNEEQRRRQIRRVEKLERASKPPDMYRTSGQRTNCLKCEGSLLSRSEGRYRPTSDPILEAQYGENENRNK